MIKYTKEQFLNDIYQAFYGQPVVAPSTPTVDRLREMAGGTAQSKQSAASTPESAAKPETKTRSKRKRVERDREGRIKAIVEEEA